MYVCVRACVSLNTTGNTMGSSLASNEVIPRDAFNLLIPINHSFDIIHSKSIAGLDHRPQREELLRAVCLCVEEVCVCRPTEEILGGISGVSEKNAFNVIKTIYIRHDKTINADLTLAL